MAIDHRIIQSIGVGSNRPVLDIFNSIIQDRRDAPLRQQQLEQGQLKTDLLTAQQPALLQQAEFAASGGTQLANQQQQNQQIATSYATALRPLLNNPQALNEELQRQKVQFQNAGVDTSGIDEDIAQLQTPEGLALLAQEVNDTLTPAGSRAKSVSQREFDDNVSSVEADPELKTIRGQAASRALGLTAKASLTKEERIANDSALASRVAENKGQQSEATETGKLKAQKSFKPAIAKAVKLAQKEATERGEVLTDLARMEASLPGVKEAVGQLIELSNVATSTLGGRAFDFLVKESGFGSTKGADARAKLVAIVDNQVLPLLKETFGAAFTVQEGENLKASLVDPDASPSQKRQQLEAFLAQKERNIRTKQEQLGQEVVTDEFSGFKVVR